MLFGNVLALLFTVFGTVAVLFLSWWNKLPGFNMTWAKFWDGAKDVVCVWPWLNLCVLIPLTLFAMFLGWTGAGPSDIGVVRVGEQNVRMGEQYRRDRDRMLEHIKFDENGNLRYRP